MLVMLCLLLLWILPLHAGRHSGDLVQIRNGGSDPYPHAGKLRYADTSATQGRRYPPRQSDGYEHKKQSDSRGDRKVYDDRRQGDRRSSNGYSDRSPVSEQRAYNKDKRTPYSSESQGNRKSSKNGARRRQDTSLDDAISRVRKHSDGRVLSAETVRNNDREEHRVRVITNDGRVRRYRLDAESGKILPRKR